MKSLKALKRISNIELYHEEIIEDENFDGEWVVERDCVYGGIVSEIYKDEIQTIKQDLEAHKQLKETWKKEEWCEGIPLNAESLKSLFKYNEELFENNLKLDKENQELKEQLEINETLSNAFEKEAFKIVNTFLKLYYPFGNGKNWDKKNGKLHFILGIESVLSYIAYLADDEIDIEKCKEALKK